MQDSKNVQKEELKKKIIDIIGDQAFCKIEKIYETVMRVFGVKKAMPFQIKIAFGLHNKIKRGGVERICWLSARGSIPAILL